MQIYMLDNSHDHVAYWFADEALGARLKRRQTGQVEFPAPGELPLRMAPGFGDAKKQRMFFGRDDEIKDLAGKGSCFHTA